MERCIECKKCIKPEMAQIPFVEHEFRIFKAHQREIRLKAFLIGSNCLWFIAAVLCFVLR